MTAKPKNYWMALGCAGLMMCGHVFADTVSYSATTPVTATSFSHGFVLPAFDSDLGTLQSISFSYDVEGSGELVFTNGSATSGGGGVTTRNVLSGSGLDLGSSGGTLVFNQIASWGGPLGRGHPGFSLSASNSDVLSIDSSEFASWESVGAGNLNLTLAADATNYGSPPSGATIFDTEFQETGTFGVTYTYSTAVAPEPSTASLLVAILGLAVLFKVSRLARSGVMRLQLGRIR